MKKGFSAVAGKSLWCFETQVGAGVKTVGMNLEYLCVDRFEVAPEVHQTKITGPYAKSHVPG